jgi:hypothetical protein
MTMPQLTKLVLCSDKSLSHTVAKNKDRMAKSSQNMSTFRRNLAHADRPLVAESGHSIVIVEVIFASAPERLLSTQSGHFLLTTL